jgi:urease accessory protein
VSGPPRWGAFRVGVGGPVGSGKTALIEALVPRLVADGADIVVVTNDIVTREDERHVKATLAGVLAPERIVGVQTGTCPHAAVREDPSMNLAVLDELAAAYPAADYAFVESGGDNLTLTFSPELVDHALFVIDVAGGDKVPRKKGIGLIRADLLVINKTDLAPHVGADLDVMAREGAEVRGGRPLLFTDCRHGDGLDALLAHLRAARAAWVASERPESAGGTASSDDARAHGHAHGPDGRHPHD